MSPQAANIVPRRYGLPFHGFVTTVDKQQAPLGALTAASRDFLVRPGQRPEGTRIARRQGTSVLGDSTGLLEMPVADATMRSCEAFRCASPSLTDGYPTYGIVWGDEDKRFGQIYLRDTNGPQDYTLLENFSATHYPTAASTSGTLKMVPLPYDGNGATGYTRGAYEENRRRHCPGTRRRVGMRKKEHFPSYQGTPSTWNRRYNRATGSGSEIMRLRPAGRVPPLWAPTFPSASYPTRTTSVRAWAEGDVFFASCMYEYEDGAFGPPFVPRDINGTLTAGFGLVTVDDDADGTAEYFTTIPWRNIPVPPPGVVRVWLLRTPKVSKTSAAAGSRPDISDLRICGYVPAGRTSYDDPNGNDLALVDDPNIVRFDHKWPERARYAWAFDQRIAYGYLRPNPCAIILAPTGAVASYDINQSDEATPNANFFHFRVDATNLSLKKTSAGVTTTLTIALSAVTLQAVVDTVNATTVASAGGEWRAAIVPGCSGSALATDLAYTSQDISCTKNGTTTLTTAASFAQVPEGCKVYGTGIPANTYVKSKASNTSLTLSAAATDSLTSTLTFAADTGDDSIVSDGSYGNIRCYCGAYEGVAALKQTALDALAGDAPQDFTFTAGGTTHARCAPESFYTSIGNRRSAMFGDEAGVLQGGAALNDGCVVFYARHIYWLRNTRAGGTGEDADYQLYVLELGRGCISPWSIVQGNGWVGCLTNDGFWVFDGKTSSIISGDVLDRDHDGGYVGEWSYEAGQCAVAAERDANTAAFHAHWTDGRLWVNYRISSTLSAYLCLDCSPSVEASGLAQLFRPDGSPYGWSARLRYSWRASTNSVSGALGSVRTASGKFLIGCDDKNDKTYCGLAQRFEVNGQWNDTGATVACSAYLVMDVCGWLRLKSLVRAAILYNLVDAGGELAAVAFPILHGSATSFSRTLPATSSAVPFSRRELPFDLGACAPTDSIQWFIGLTTVSGDGGKFEVAGIESDVELLDSTLT